jgi:hypothetical protein
MVVCRLVLVIKLLGKDEIKSIMPRGQAKKIPVLKIAPGFHERGWARIGRVLLKQRHHIHSLLISLREHGCGRLRNNLRACQFSCLCSIVCISNTATCLRSIL